VLVLTETGARKVQAALIHKLAVIHKRIRADGSGTLTFGASSGFAGGLASMYDNTGMDLFGAFYGTPPPPFHAIPDAERVYRLVAERQTRIRKGPGPCEGVMQRPWWDTSIPSRPNVLGRVHRAGC
jgi:hypothetical protein